MVLNSVLILGGIGLFFGLGLAFIGKKLAVEIDPLEENILQVLPGSNCGACGFAGCAGYAVECLKENADIGKCALGGEKVVRQISDILGKEAKIKEDSVAVVLCQGKEGISKDRFVYEGIADCSAANLISEGNKECVWACLGFGTCMEVCPFGAIRMDEGIPLIDEEKCKGCGLCVPACPRGLITLISKRHRVYVLCRSKEKGKIVRESCEKGCIGCGLCVKVCPTEAIQLKDNLAVIDYDKCSNCGKCVEKCPTKSIVLNNSSSSMQFLS